MTQKLQQLQQAIREVCTELYVKTGVMMTYDGLVCDTAELKEIQLQHILRAIEAKDPGEWLVRTDGYIYVDMNQYVHLSYYKLELPLDQQPPEVIDFLHSIICKG